MIRSLPLSVVTLSRRGATGAFRRNHDSEIELHCKLNQSRVIARRSDAAEVAWINDLTSSGINYGGVEIAVRCVEVNLIEEVEEFGSKFNALRFAEPKPLDEREVDVDLSGPSQDVAPNVADVGTLGSSNRATV